MQVKFPVRIHPDLCIITQKLYLFFFDPDVDLLKPKYTKNKIFS